VFFISLIALLLGAFRRSVGASGAGTQSPLDSVHSARQELQTLKEQIKVLELRDPEVAKQAALQTHLTLTERDQRENLYLKAKVSDLENQLETIKNGAQPLFHPDPNDKGPRIEYAVFGAAGDEPIDVTSRIRSLVIDKKEIWPNIQCLGLKDDPHPFATKYLTVTLSITQAEGEQVNLPMDWFTRSPAKPQRHTSVQGLEYAGWHGNTGRLPTFFPNELSSPSWINIRNSCTAPNKSAQRVTVQLGFVNSTRTQLWIVPEAVWFEQQSNSVDTVVEKWSHEVSIEGGDDQSFVLFAQDENGRVIPHKDGGEPLPPLDYDHWDVKVVVSSDNVRGFEGIIRFTQTRNNLTPDQPAFIKLRDVEPRFETIERYLQ
jgi:hypothetical protein